MKKWIIMFFAVIRRKTAWSKHDNQKVIKAETP